MLSQEWITLAGTLFGGIVIGWLLREWYRAMRSVRPQTELTRRAAARKGRAYSVGRQPKSNAQLRRHVQQVEHALAESQQAIAEHEAELVRADSELARRDREIEALRNSLESRESEHDALVSELGELRARMAEVGADIYRQQQDLIRREQELSAAMSAIAERNHELELLTEIDAGYQADMDELTQEIQLQDGEVARLNSVLASKTREHSEAQALLGQREVELNRIIREREDVEHRIEQVRQQHDLVVGEHERLLNELREASEQTDMRARLLRALREQSREETESLLVEDTGEPDEPAQQPLPAIESPEQDDLTRIKGIGDGYAGLLQAAGILTYDQLATITPGQIRQILEAPQWRLPNVEAWIAEARALAGEAGTHPFLETGDDDLDEQAVDVEVAWLEGLLREDLDDEDGNDEGQDEGADDDYPDDFLPEFA